MKRKYGWIKQKRDYRDLKLNAYPPSIDLRPQMPPIYDQGDLGSCSANAICAAIDFERKKQGLEFLTPSRLFVYYNERKLEGTIAQDAGAELRDGMKVISKYGACSETEWPYNVSQFAVQPPNQDYTDALNNKVLKYFALSQDIHNFKTCLKDGYPIIFGFVVYPSFESDSVAQTGVLNMPSLMDKLQGPVGGHAVVIVGYDDASQRFLVRNSWGGNWGDGGYFTMPYAYVSNPSLASDFWTLRLVEA